METKTCLRCGQTKSKADFGRNSATSDGLQSECRRCMRNRYRESHGGVPHLLRHFTDDELRDELARRTAMADGAAWPI